MKSRRQRRLAAALPRQEALGEARRAPRGRSSCVDAHLGQVEGRQLGEGDPTGQRLAGLGEQVDRGGAEQQEAAGPFAFAPAGVDHPAQRFEQARGAVDLVEDDQLVGVVGEVELGLAIRARSASDSRSR